MNWLNVKLETKGVKKREKTVQMVADYVSSILIYIDRKNLWELRFDISFMDWLDCKV